MVPCHGLVTGQGLHVATGCSRTSQLGGVSFPAPGAYLLISWQLGHHQSEPFGCLGILGVLQETTTVDENF